MQSSKPLQAGIMVAANYDKNSGCWPIIVPIRQTRRVITCQVLKINTVLVKYLGLHVPCKYRGPRGYFHMSATIFLPWVLEAFHARFPVSASSETQGHESVALGKKHGLRGVYKVLTRQSFFCPCWRCVLGVILRWGTVII